MAQVTTLGVDIAKNGVCAQGIDTQGHVTNPAMTSLPSVCT